MIKKILLLLVILLIAAGGLFAYTIQKKRTLIAPYPYAFTPSWDKKFEVQEAKNIQQATNAKILVVGDRMAKSLVPFQQTLQESFGDNFKTPPTIFNWSTPNEGLFRTLHKLKKLPKLPPVIIYFGTSTEFYEKRFEVQDKPQILKNFAQYDDEKIISLIITFPILSRYFYQKMNYIDLEAAKEYKNVQASQLKLDEKEVAFKLFEYELRDLIQYVKDKKSNLVFITAPINLEAPPKEVCAHSSSPDVVALQQELEGQIKEGEFKAVYPTLQELASETYGNAMTFHLLGRAALGAGELTEAREAFLKASVYDCENWRANAVYNAIIRKEAKKDLLHVVDFEKAMSNELSNEGLFLDDIYPQVLFYQNMIKELGDILMKILSVTP